MTLRNWNKERLGWYLDRDLPDSWPGSPDPEQIFENKKSEGRVILRGASYDRIDASFRAKDMNLTFQERDEANRYAQTDRVLTHLIFEYMPDKCPLYSSAVKEFIITENVAGGKVEVERLRKKGEEGFEQSALIVSYYDKWEKIVLDILDYFNFRLWVQKDHRVYTKQQGADYNTGRVSGRIDRDAQIYAKFIHMKEENPTWPDTRIKQKIALVYGTPYTDPNTGMERVRPLSPETVNRAIHRPDDSHEKRRRRKPRAGGEGAA